MRREPIMAYGDDVASSDSGSASRRSSKDRLDPRKSIERSKPVEKKRQAKLNRQSMSEQLFHRLNEDVELKRSISQQNLKQDISMEAVVIDLPSMDGKYDRAESSSTFGNSTDSREGSDVDVDGVSSEYFSRWGPVRGSNSYSDTQSVPVSQLSTLNLRASIVSNKSHEQTDSAV